VYLTRKVLILLIISVLALAVLSCSEKEEGEAETTEQAQEEERLSYVSEVVNIGVFFDEEGTKRSITLEEGQKEFNAYIIIGFPEGMKIGAVEWRLELPEGTKIINDRYFDKRFMTLGTFEKGLSEAFPCIPGPRLLIHDLKIKVEGELKNAEISILPGLESGFVGIAECREGHPEVRAACYKAVINP